MKSLKNGEKKPTNIPKWKHKLPKITNAEKPTKMGTKMPNNLPNWEPKLPKTQLCAIKTAENPVKCALMERVGQTMTEWKTFVLY